MIFAVHGPVGLVEEGKIFWYIAALIISDACPPLATSV